MRESEPAEATNRRDTPVTAETIPGEALDLDTAVAKADQSAPDNAPAPVPLKEATRRFALIDAFKSALDDYVKSERPHMLGRLNAAAEDTDSKSFNVKIDGETVATMTITQPQDKIVVDDDDALADYALDNYPTEVETVTRVRESFEKVLLKKVKAEDVTPEPTEDNPEPEQVWMIVDPDTGEEVPGLKRAPAPPPSSFSIRWKGKEQKAQALDGLFAQVAPLLGIEAGESNR
jgi:hypothetical protein